MTIASNAALYDTRGISAIHASLRPGGVLAVWSINDDPSFERRLRARGFNVHRVRVPARLPRKGPRYSIVLAETPRGRQ
jgi:hypothetical protein